MNLIGGTAGDQGYPGPRETTRKSRVSASISWGCGCIWDGGKQKVSQTASQN